MASSDASPSGDRERPDPDRPQAEQARLRTLRRYAVVGTQPEPNFDRITRVAASLFDAPIALISFVAEDQQWFKSAVGVESGGRGLEQSFCLEAIRSDGTTVIEDATKTERFADHPLVSGPMGVRFYAGAPLKAPNGCRIGTLCVLDTAPRQLSDEEAGRLQDLAEMVMSELELRRNTKEKLQERDERLQSIAENVSEGIYRSTPDEGLVNVNQAFAEMFGYDSVEEVLGVAPEELYADPDERERILEKADEQGGLDGKDIEFRRADGSTFTGRVTDTVVRGDDGKVLFYGGVIADVTERKRRERELQKNERRFEALFDDPNILAGLLDEDGKLLGANRTSIEYIEARPEEVIGEPFWETPWWTDEMRGTIREKVLTAASGEYVEYEADLNRPDGTPYSVTGSIRPVTDEEGTVVSLFVTARDITRRKRRERKLKESRRKLRKEKRRIQAITENVSDGIYRSTAEEGIVYANQAFIGMFGYRDLEKLKAAGSEALYADQAQRKELIEKEIENGRLDREEVRFRRKDGTTFIGLLSSQQVEGKDQEKTYFDGAITDITERKRREEELRQRRRDIEALYETTRRLLRAESREAVYDRIHGVLRRVFDHDLVNTGIREEDVVRPVRTDRGEGAEVPAPSPSPIDGNSISAQVLQNRGTVVVTDLDDLENEFDYGNLRSAAGVPIGERGVIIVGRVGDGSFDRFNLRLVEVLAGYAALVLGRLEREDELLRAKKEAEEAARLKASMLANMSHEIRTPLTSIIGFSETIGEEIKDLEDRPREANLPQLARFARLIEQGGNRLLDTVDDILNLSKLEAGDTEMNARSIDLGEQAGRVASELKPKAEDAGLDLTVKADDTSAQADEGGVQIVLQNLLSNAIKYTEEGGEVWVRVYRNEAKAILEVEDTGIGMEPEVAETLFEPFRQASEGIDREHEGVGIGLAVVRRAVEQMGGTVAVKTQKGEGSRFTVQLPRADRAD